MVMFDCVSKLVLSLVPGLLQLLLAPQPKPHFQDARKSVAIVGAGTAGLSVLHALLDLPDSNIDVVVYEQRQDVGGIWLPDPQPSPLPALPETPLYPLLHTNTPAPSITCPGLPFPPGTPLFPSHDHIENYHRDLAMRYNLMPYIAFNHTVLSASWVGSSEEGSWDIAVADQYGHETRRLFDHLVVATGRNHYPHVITFPGQDEWLRHGRGANDGGRKILHSISYREPERYANKTVIVVGSGASGRDVASQVVLYAKKVYNSVRTLRMPPEDLVEVKPEIAYFTSDAVVFTDGSREHDIDAVVLATGYDLRIPFLEVTGEVSVKPEANERDGGGLTTNLRYLFPLHQQIFSLCTSYPTNALAFIGLPTRVAYCPTDSAQSIFAAHVIANASLLGPRKALMEELDECEDDVRERGQDPYAIGHRMEGLDFDYQELLIDKLREQGKIPDDGTEFVDAWRREAKTYQHLKRGWKRVEDLGEEKQWLKDVETEAEWADMMKRLNEWQKEWEIAQGLVFPEEPTIF